MLHTVVSGSTPAEVIPPSPARYWGVVPSQPAPQHNPIPTLNLLQQLSLTPILNPIQRLTQCRHLTTPPIQPQQSWTLLHCLANFYSSQTRTSNSDQTQPCSRLSGKDWIHEEIRAGERHEQPYRLQLTALAALKERSGD